MTASVDTVDVARRLACCGDDLDLEGQRAQLSLFQLLAKGHPVDPADVAARAGLTTSEFLHRLDRWHGVQTDQAGRILAFRGLSIIEAPNRLKVNETAVYTWCAWDTLFLPELIGQAATVESACKMTGVPISLRVDESGPADLSPPAAVLSLLVPDSGFADDVIASFCSLVHFFASGHAARAWVAEHPGTFVMSVPEGYEIGRHVNAIHYGEALESAKGDKWLQTRVQ
jgi:alkylmercury lyase